MGKNRYLAILPILMTGVMISGCAEPILTDNGLNDVYNAIEKIQATDYRSEINSMVFYTKSTYNEKFVAPADYADAKNAGFRIVIDEVLTRIDFSNPDDMYYYNLTARTYKYLTNFDNVTGNAGYTDTLVRFGYQFYKNEKGNYTLQMVGSRGIEAVKSLKLEDYPYITPSNELKNIESTIKSTQKTSFNKEEATVLFNEFFTKIVEHNYRISNEVVDSFESDKTGGYKYYATDTSFTIQESGEFDFQYQKAATATRDVTVKEIKVGDPVEGTDYINVAVKFSNNKTANLQVQASDIPEDLTQETYNTVTYIDESTNTWYAFNIDTNIPSTELVVSGENAEVLINNTAGLDKTQSITEKFTTQNKFWANTEVVNGKGERNVTLEYGKYGFLTSSYMSDERASKEFIIPEGCAKFYTTYYTTAEYNVVVPHVFGK